MYPTELVLPMKQELIENGFEDLSTPEVVEAFLSKKGTALLVVNSVCGCSAGAARPAAIFSIRAEKKPDYLGTVFAGYDLAAVQTARERMLPFPPSSPSIALFRDGKLVHMIERHHIEGNSATAIADNLVAAYEEYC